MLEKPKKLCKTCGKNPRHTGRTECVGCIWEKQRQKQRKPIAKISANKKQRIASEGSEHALFNAVWSARADGGGRHWCEVCGCEIREARAWCFAHKLSKGRHPEYRLYDKNITLVCSPECHREHDKQNAGHDAEIIATLTSKPLVGV